MASQVTVLCHLPRVQGQKQKECRFRDLPLCFHSLFTLHSTHAEGINLRPGQVKSHVKNCSPCTRRFLHLTWQEQGGRERSREEETEGARHPTNSCARRKHAPPNSLLRGQQQISAVRSTQELFPRSEKML